MGNWSKLKADEKVRVIKFARLNGVSDMKTIRDTFNMYADGGDLGAYNTFVETLPDNMKHTDPAKYDMYRYWELNGRPKDFEEAKKREMFHKELDGYYHASTLAEVTNSPDKHYGTLEFIKAKNHNTIGLEIGAYLKDKNHPMRNREYILDYTGDKARYRPRTYSESILPEGAYVGNIPITALYKNGGPLTHKKSTGGPLYPFSFEKNPFLKTPVVRYDEGGFFTRLFGKKDASPTPEEIKADRVERFINDTWETEYSVPKGYDSTTGLFYPYKSPEGGTKTIGPGFKLRKDGSGDATMFSAKEAARGVTREQINEKLKAQGDLQYDKVLEFLNQKGNRLPVDTINPNIMNGLMDLRFLVGALGGWDNLREAVLNGDLEGIKKESLVTFKDGNTGKIKPDTRRNELRAEKFWHYN